MQVSLARWQESAPPREQALRQQMQQEGLSPYVWSNGPGEQYTVHLHTYEKVLYCVQGSIRFILPDYPDGAKKMTILDLNPGDCMILPAGVRHSAQVGPDGVTCLEAARR